MTSAEKHTIGPLLHGAARAWRNKLDERLRPLGLSQAKWRTLSHLARSEGQITQADLAQTIGIEEPTLVNLLHRLEKEGWVKRRSAAHDRRCKTVHLQKRANVVLAEIRKQMDELRGELIAGIPARDLQVCLRVLERIRLKADTAPGIWINGNRRMKEAAK